MVLVDTSLWISHLRKPHEGLIGLLDNGEVACHPFIVGELACGNLRNRTMLLSLFDALPQVSVAEHEEVLSFIESKRLMGKGLGYVDAHLLASAVLTGVPLWTRDRNLERAAESLECDYRTQSP